MTMKLLRLAVLLLSLLVPGKALATTWYVNVSTGDDGANDCTEAQSPFTPKQTIAAALACVGFGAGSGADDVVEVASGTYTAPITAFPQGTSGHPFTLRSTTQYGALLAPGGGSTQIVTFDKSYVTLDGFTIDGTGVSANNVVVGVSLSGIVIEDNEIRDTEIGADDGIGSFQGVYVASSGTIIRRNYIHDIAPSATNHFNHGIYIQASSVTVDSNVIDDVGGNGMQAFGATQNNITVTNNRISDWAQSTGVANSIYIEGNNAIVYNNVLFQTSFNAQSYGLAVIGSSNVVYNNTMVQVANDGIQLIGTSNVRNNLLYQIGGTPIYQISGTHTVNTNLEDSADPLFANLGSFDFNLTSTSPARNTGVGIGSVTTDIAGTARPQEGSYDLGAYEFVGGGGGGGGKHAVGDCNRATLASKLAESGVIDGDTIVIPAGTCNYTSQLVITKCVSLTGAGATGGTTIVHTSSHLASSFTYSAAIKFNLGSCTNFMEITGFHFTRSCTGGCTSNDDQIFDGILEITSANCGWNNLRIHHNKFTMVFRDHGMGLRSSCIGALVDHNEYTGDGNGFKLYGSGNGDWTTSLGFGTSANYFTTVEDNTFTGPADCSPRGWGDLHTGGRVIFRRNRLTNEFFQTHDQVLSGNPSSNAWEVYQNTFASTVTCGNLDHAIRLLGGTGISFGNTITGPWWGGVGIYNESSWMHRSPGFGSETPGGICNGGYAGDANILSNGWLCRYQIGSHGLTPSAVSAPAYFFLNTCNSLVADCASGVANAIPYGSSTIHLIANRDYFNRNTSTCAAGGGSCVGGGSGNLSQRPTNCTTGAFWWSVDQGEWDSTNSGADGQMSVCTSTNTWSTKYGPNNTTNSSGTPSQYPHTLGGFAAIAPAPATNIRINAPAVK